MDGTTLQPASTQVAQQARDRVLRAVIGVVGFAAFFASLFGAAGTWRWPAAWALIGIAIAFKGVNAAVLMKVNPELLRRRSRAGEGTKRWDRVWLGVSRLLALAPMAVAGLDAVRYRWNPLGFGAWWAGLALFALSSALMTWAMVANTHFEGTVRIQSDRGHRVADGGPYRFVRHPGYVSFIGSLLAVPLLLQSAWAFIPAAVAAAWVVVRTSLEDRTLQRELEGYADYAGRVRFRLLPGVW